MNFYKVNNNMEPNRMLIESGYVDTTKDINPAAMAVFEPKRMLMEPKYQHKNMNVDTSTPVTFFGNCRSTEFQDDYSFDDFSIVENFDEERDIKDIVKGIIHEDESDYIPSTVNQGGKDHTKRIIKNERDKDYYTKGIKNENHKDYLKFIKNEDDKYYMKGLMNEDCKDHMKNKKLSDARVVLEKLPDSVAQEYLAKKAKNYETMNFKHKSPRSSALRSIRKENHRATPVLTQYIAKRKTVETDEFVKELCNSEMQQYLANTEMGCLASNFMEQIPKPQEYTARVNNCTTDSLIENLSGTDEINYPVKMERNDLQRCSAELEKVMENYNTDNFQKSLSYPTVPQCYADLSGLNMQEPHVDVEKVDNFVQKPANIMDQGNIYEKRTLSRKISGFSRRRSKKNSTATQWKRICPTCRMYVHETHKTSAKVKCRKCQTITMFECKKCKKQAQTYSAVCYHLLHQCEARLAIKCAHCHYTVRKKHVLATHLHTKHVELLSHNFISQSRSKNTVKITNKSFQGSGNDRQYENLIVLKKQKEMACKSEWYIENVKRSESQIDNNIVSSVPRFPVLISTPSVPVPIFTPSVPVSISTPSEPDPTSVKEMSKLYCDYCDTKMAINGPCANAEIICRVCGSILIFKCSKCQSTCESYYDMRQHLKKDCTLKENKKKNNRKCFYCSECNYRSYFEGLVFNHQNKIHSVDILQEVPYNNSIQNFNEDDSNFYLSEHQTGEFEM